MLQDVQRIPDGVRAEKNPGKTDQVESEKYLESIHKLRRQRYRQRYVCPVPENRTDHENSVQCTPNNKCPIRAVPESTGKHRQHGREGEYQKIVGCKSILPEEAAQRKKNIVP